MNIGIEGMHYDFKQKLNKIDSQQYKNLRIPEIDWKLNEAFELYIKMIAFPRIRKEIGFEINTRTIEDIRTLLVNQSLDKGDCIDTQPCDDVSVLAPLPEDYMFHVESYAFACKGDCEASIRTTVVQHDDEHEESPFDRSNFEWRQVNIRFVGNNIRIFNDKTFTVKQLCLDYVSKPVYIHYAQGFTGGQYSLPNGIVLTGKQDCNLPDHTVREIVDLAVLITTGDLQISDYAIKNEKIKLLN